MGFSGRDLHVCARSIALVVGEVRQFVSAGVHPSGGVVVNQ